MTSPSPQVFGAAFDEWCAAATTFWARNTLPPADGAAVVVELLAQDVRVAVRALTVANAIRRIVPAQLVVIVGVDEDWASVFDYYDEEGLTRLARAYGASEIVPVHLSVDRCVAATGGDVARHTHPTGVDPISSPVLEDVVRATAARVLRVPRITDAIRQSAKYAEIRRRAAGFVAVYDDLLARVGARAVVTSHVDYAQWGLLVDAADRAGVPTVHVQSTGGLKAYCSFDRRPPSVTHREALTSRIAESFEREVWRHRAVLRRSGEHSAWRAKGNLGRPSWWRGGGDVSRLELRTPEERRDLRRHTVAHLGLTDDRPIIGVYDHAVSDALNTNREAFADLAAWLDETARYAAAHDDVQWLFVDHPHQDVYDGTGHFARLAALHAPHRHLAFVRSLDLTKNQLFSAVDLAVTVRGSISAELPVYGIPAIQAGWSEWSGCGFTTVADDEASYWSALDHARRQLVAGRALISSEQIERARLWLWLYRSGADVVSPLVPHWETGQNAALFQDLVVAMRHVDSDADPAFVAVSRAWSRRDPFLTRVDLTVASTELADRLGALPSPPAAPTPRGGLAMATSFDDPVVVASPPWTCRTGHSPELQVANRLARGVSILGRCGADPTQIGLKVDAAGAPLRVRISLALDDASENWWDERAPADLERPTGRRSRPLVVRAQGRERARVDMLHGRGDGPHVRSCEFVLEPGEVDASGLVVIEVAGREVTGPVGGGVAAAAIGLRIDCVEVTGAGVLASQRPPVAGPAGLA